MLNMKMTVFIFREWKKKYWYYLYSEKLKVEYIICNRINAMLMKAYTIIVT